MTTLWVKGGPHRVGMNGTDKKPFNTIKQAMAWADLVKDAVEVRVWVGEYTENVVIPKRGNLLIRGWGGRPKITPTDPTQSTINGFDVHNITLRNLEIDGGKNGIQFGMSGIDSNQLDKYCSDITVELCVIRNTTEDGIKISQSDRVKIYRNKIENSGDQGIDFVAVNDGKIVGNEVSGVTGSSAAIFVKGGSTRGVVSGNWVHDCSRDGINIGGWTGPEWFRPQHDTYEARDYSCTGNLIERVGKRPIAVIGAVDCVVEGNTLKSPPVEVNYWQMQVGPAQLPGMNSRNVSVINNAFSRKEGMCQKVGENITMSGNIVGEHSAMLASVGP